MQCTGIQGTNGISPKYEIWENEKSVCQVEHHGTGYRIIIFKKTSDSLHFMGAAVYNDWKKLERLINKLGIVRTNKSLKLL